MAYSTLEFKSCARVSRTCLNNNYVPLRTFLWTEAPTLVQGPSRVTFAASLRQLGTYAREFQRDGRDDYGPRHGIQIVHGTPSPRQAQSQARWNQTVNSEA